jgi:hypothetical protein
MPLPPLLSVDPRTAPLFLESGCKDSDSHSIWEALGPARAVTALARGRQGSDPVAIVVADDRFRLVSVGFRANMGNAFRGTGNVRLDAPIGSVALTVKRQRQGTVIHEVLLLQASGEQFSIQDVSPRALERLQQVVAVVPAPPSEPAADGTPDSAPPPPTPQSPRDSMRPADATPGPPATDWRQAEQLAVWHLRQLGYHDARATPAGADAGADVLATGAVAQVKHWAQPVGQPPLRDLFGVAQATGARPLFYSYSGYTPQALQWASATKTALFTYTIWGEVVGQNAAAHELVRANGQVGGKRLGFFASVRADGYRREQESLRREIETLTTRIEKRTQSRRPAARRAAGEAAGLLDQASRTLDAGDVLPPADRRREDTYKVVRNALTHVKRML